MKRIPEWLAALGLLWMAHDVAGHYRQLPSVIEVHFSQHRGAIGWADKSTLWVNVGTACALYLLMYVLQIVMHRIPDRCFRDSANAKQMECSIPQVREMCGEILGWLKLVLVSAFAAICHMTICRAMGSVIPTWMQLAAAIAPGASVAIILFGYGYRMKRH